MSALANRVGQTYLFAVDDIVRAAVRDDAAQIRYRGELVCRDIIIVDFAVNAESAYSARDVGVAGAAEVNDRDHILFHYITTFIDIDFVSEVGKSGVGAKVKIRIKRISNFNLGAVYTGSRSVVINASCPPVRVTAVIHQAVQ